MTRKAFLATVILLLSLSPRQACQADAPPVNDEPAMPGEWDFRPRDGETCPTTPPAFVWRPQKGASSYELQCSRDPRSGQVDYEAADIPFNCHCPSKTLDSGTWHWHFRFRDKEGRPSAWSKTRSFVVWRYGQPQPFPIQASHPTSKRFQMMTPSLKSILTSNSRNDPSAVWQTMHD